MTKAANDLDRLRIRLITTMILGDLTSGYFKLFTLGNLPVGSPI